jgi:hypothetical protein
VVIVGAAELEHPAAKATTTPKTLAATRILTLFPDISLSRRLLPRRHDCAHQVLIGSQHINT